MSGNNTSMNIRSIAVEIGDALKYDTSINEINRIASAILPFQYDPFPNDAITSQRAKLIYDWILGLGRYRCTPTERSKLLTTFVQQLAPEGEVRERVLKILNNAGVEGINPDQDVLRRFDACKFHSEIVRHCRKLYGQQNYFHAVFEAAKVYNNLIRDKAQSDKDGEPLMMNVWDPRNGSLKITPCETETRYHQGVCK